MTMTATTTKANTSNNKSISNDHDEELTPFLLQEGQEGIVESHSNTPDNHGVGRMQEDQQQQQNPRDQQLPLSLIGNDPVKQQVQSNKSTLEILSYAAVFFLAMVGHELAMEAATTEFQDVESIAYGASLFQFGFCFLLPLIVSCGSALKAFPRTTRDLLPYIRLSLVVFGATALASFSLQYVTYPTKVVFKSAKLIPTMVVATALQGTKYGFLDYTAALLLCIGAAGYSYNSAKAGDGSNSLPGLVLLFISIVCDAFVPNLQQQFLSPPKSLQATELMVNVNAVGWVSLTVYMVVVGQLQRVIHTCWTYPKLIVYLVLIGLGLSTAVLAYTKLIKASGSVVAVAVATLRKVATVVLSYVFFPKAVHSIHILSGFLVLGGVIVSAVSKQQQRRRQEKHQR